MADTPKFLPYLIAAGGLLIGALFIFLGSRLWKSSRELATTGVSVNATVSKKFQRDEGATWGGLENTFVRLTYTDADGRAQEAELKVATKIWRQLDEGGSFGITYLPAQPGNVFPHTVLAHKIRCGVAVALFAVGAVAVIVFPVGGLREAWRARADHATAGEHPAPGS